MKFQISYIYIWKKNPEFLMNYVVWYTSVSLILRWGFKRKRLHLNILKKRRNLSSGTFEYAWFGFVVQNQKASVSVRLQRPNKESWVIFLQLYSFLGFGLIKNGIDFGTQPSLFSPLWNLHVCAIIFRASRHFMKKTIAFHV